MMPNDANDEKKFDSMTILNYFNNGTKDYTLLPQSLVVEQ